MRGQASHLTRAVYVYLPPQYFQAKYSDYRFPVIELLHGFPGQPQDWITVIGDHHDPEEPGRGRERPSRSCS